MYGLPTKVEFCSNCTRSNQRPHNIGEFLQKIKIKKLLLAYRKIKFVTHVVIILKNKI